MSKVNNIRFYDSKCINSYKTLFLFYVNDKVYLDLGIENFLKNSFYELLLDIGVNVSNELSFIYFHSNHEIISKKVKLIENTDTQKILKIIDIIQKDVNRYIKKPKMDIVTYLYDFEFEFIIDDKFYHYVLINYFNY
jgi:hypothetical protein